MNEKIFKSLCLVMHKLATTSAKNQNETIRLTMKKLDQINKQNPWSYYYESLILQVQ